MFKTKLLRRGALLASFTMTILFFQNCKQSGEISVYDQPKEIASTNPTVDANGNIVDGSANGSPSDTDTTPNLNPGSDTMPGGTPGTTSTDPTTTNPTPPPTPTTPPTTTTTNPVPKTPEELMSSCEQARVAGRLTRLERQVTFADPAKQCAWGVNGNLSMLNSYVRAREEQIRAIELPTGAKVCNVMLKNLEEQSFVYDDNIIITLNNIILASTTNFTSYFSGQNGLYKYEWSKLVNQPAQNSEADTAPDKQFCAGKALGQSSCSFPVTEQAGSVMMSFDKVIIQNVLGITSPTSLSLGVITTGDNNGTDCQHVPLTFKVELDYYE